MDQLNILHVTDLHFRDASPVPTAGHVKDKKGLSPRFKHELGYGTTYDQLLNHIVRLVGSSKIDLIACTGDLGWQGDPNCIHKGITFLERLSRKVRVPANRVVVVPGNHDICQDARRRGDDLKKLVEACRGMHFICPVGDTPVCLKVKNIPVVCFNSCLGGTEHAVYGSARLWSKVFKNLKAMTADKKLAKAVGAEVSDQLAALDIPAIGSTQLEKAMTFLGKSKSNCCIVLMHHNPLPTPGVEVRPYGGLIDAGALMFRLLTSGRRVILLHGHTHWDSVMSAFTPDGTNEDGFVTAIGCSGMGGLTAEEASHIRVVITMKKHFGVGVVSRFQRVGTVWQEKGSFPIWNLTNSKDGPTLDISRLKKGQSLTVRQAATQLNRRPTSSLASQLLAMCTRRQLEIQNINGPASQWRIIRRA